MQSNIIWLNTIHYEWYSQLVPTNIESCDYVKDILTVIINDNFEYKELQQLSYFEKINYSRGCRFINKSLNFYINAI
jgi:hypothetical protein